MTTINPVRHRTPHAAVLVWNYEDRLGIPDSPDEPQSNTVNQIIISTVSLISVSTKKSKGEPVGRFEINLAPTRNWVSEITSGSWMCILMSQHPITQVSLTKAQADKVKFFGKIESVRFSTAIIDPQSGARGSGYVVTGVDWAHIFENNIYIDPFIEKDTNTIGSTTYIDLFEKVIGVDSRSSILTTTTNIKNLIQVLGLPFGSGIVDTASSINRVAKADYSFSMPTQVQNYFNFTNQGQYSYTSNIVDSLEIVTGTLIGPDKYKDAKEAFGWIDPSSLRGINTLWQLIIDNACTVLNETLTDMRWNTDGSPTLVLYNRIKPFAFRSTSEIQKRIEKALNAETFGVDKTPLTKPQNPADIVLSQVKKIMSKYQLLRTYTIPLEEIIDFNAGTNWRDKFNFAEIKPGWQNADLLANWAKTVAQTADVKAFKREGFRPLIVTTKQFPTSSLSTQVTPTNDLGIDINVLAGWKQLLREWYFDTHRLLNGSMTIVGQSEYIQVGQNIRFSADVMGKSHNFNKGTIHTPKNVYILAHVESISHSFRVSPDGARSYTTTINFVRGIVVSANGSLIGGGTTDGKHSAMTETQHTNTNNVIGLSTPVDPDPRKLKGR